MSEPDFIFKCEGPFADNEERLKWFHGCVDETKPQGATWARYTIHPEHGWALFEAWKIRPQDDGGVYRWHDAEVRQLGRSQNGS